MKNPQSSRRDRRDWHNPVAKKVYEHKVDSYQHEQRAIISSQARLIVETVQQVKHIELTCLNVDMLLLHIAQLAGVRLYNKQVDNQSSRYAKRKQGEHQKIMRQAFAMAIESGEITYTVTGLHHTVDVVTNKQDVAIRPILVDGVYLPDPRSDAKLRRWKEPAS